jgi:CHAT domain
MQTILFLAANPKDTSRLRVDEELRDIGYGLQRAQQRDQFRLEQRSAVRSRDIQRAMLDIEPQIVHFSGHGSGEQGLVFEDEVGNSKLIDGSALAELFDLFANRLTCVVLNGCYSEVQAKAITQFIPFVIGMSQSIGDRAAISFAVGFYDALGAGKDVEFAYKLGCSAIRLEGIDIDEHSTPVLLKKSPINRPNSENPPEGKGSSGSSSVPEKGLSCLSLVIVGAALILMLISLYILSNKKTKDPLPLPPTKPPTIIWKNGTVTVKTPNGESQLTAHVINPVHIINGDYDWKFESAGEISVDGKEQKFNDFYQEKLKEHYMQNQLMGYKDVVSIGTASCEGSPSTEKDRALERAEKMNAIITKAIPKGSKVQQLYRLNLGQFVSKPSCPTDPKATSRQRIIMYIGVDKKPLEQLEREALCLGINEWKRQGLIEFTPDDYTDFDLFVVAKQSKSNGNYRCPR